MSAQGPPFYLAKTGKMPRFAKLCFFGFFLHLTVRGRRALSRVWWRFTQMITRLRHMATRKDRYNCRAVEQHCVCCKKGRTVADTIISVLKFGSLVKNLNQPISLSLSLSLSLFFFFFFIARKHDRE